MHSSSANQFVCLYWSWTSGWRFIAWILEAAGSCFCRDRRPRSSMHRAGAGHHDKRQRLSAIYAAELHYIDV